MPTIDWITITSGSVTIRYNGVALQLFDSTHNDLLITLGAERTEDLLRAMEELRAALEAQP